MTIDATKHWGTNIWYAASQHDITCVYVSIFFSVYIYIWIYIIIRRIRSKLWGDPQMRELQQFER
jgi:hypothetical protein